MTTKRGNIYALIAFVWYIGFSRAFAAWVNANQIKLPMWLKLSFSEILILTAIIVFLIIEKANPLRCFALRILNPLEVAESILLGVCILPVTAVLNLLSQFFTTNKMTGTMEIVMQLPFYQRFFFIAVIPAIVEEFACRGFFYHMYRKGGILPASLMTALIFGLLHGNLNQFCYAFAAGVLFCFFVEATASLFTSMLSHMTINTVPLLLMEAYNRAGLLETVQSSSGSGISSIPMAGIIFAFIFHGSLAIGFGFLGYVLLKAMSKKAGRWEYFQREMKAGLHAKEGQQFFSIPLFIAILLAVIPIIQSI
jgi:membrane protease YdiL (CAAX protease family)